MGKYAGITPPKSIKVYMMRLLQILLQSEDIWQIFHRFMSRTDKIQFMVNGDPIEPIDPFLRKEDGYQEEAYDRQISQGNFIEMQVHILPHHDKISRELLERMGGADEIANKQGFYIYRGKRLIVEGGWLGLP